MKRLAYGIWSIPSRQICRFFFRANIHDKYQPAVDMLEACPHSISWTSEEQWILLRFPWGSGTNAQISTNLGSEDLEDVRLSCLAFSFNFFLKNDWTCHKHLVGSMLLIASVLRLYWVAGKSHHLLILIAQLDKKGVAVSKVMKSRISFPNSKMKKQDLWKDMLWWGSSVFWWATEKGWHAHIRDKNYFHGCITPENQSEINSWHFFMLDMKVS